MELLYKDAEGRRQRQEKYLREVLQQEQLQREFKPLQRSHALLYKKFKKDFVNLLHSVAPNSNAEDSSSITIDKDTLAAVCYRLGLIKDEVCAAVLVISSPAAGAQR
jgi:predicted nucleic-acid-binding protein